MESIQQCRLCSLSLKTRVRDDKTGKVTMSCSRCGEYVMDARLYEEVGVLDGERPWLMCAARQAHEIGSRIVLTIDNYASIAKAHAATDVRVNAEHLLAHIARLVPRPGQWVTFNNYDYDYPIIDVLSKEELRWYVKYLVELGYLAPHGALHWEITFSGWRHLTASDTDAVVKGQCFVAMSFAPEHRSIYDDGIRPALHEAGYRPVCMFDLPTNENINARMIVEIRRSEIAVADFTGQRAGVYFEAGFASALGREVFWTCKHDELELAHFDTKHFQHVDWQDSDDLRSRLRDKIVALRGFGPHSRTP